MAFRAYEANGLVCFLKGGRVPPKTAILEEERARTRLNASLQNELCGKYVGSGSYG